MPDPQRGGHCPHFFPGSCYISASTTSWWWLGPALPSALNNDTIDFACGRDLTHIPHFDPEDKWWWAVVGVDMVRVIRIDAVVWLMWREKGGKGQLVPAESLEKRAKKLSPRKSLSWR